MSCWAAATPNASINSREDLNVGIIAMRFWAELAYGKSIGGRADQNGRFFRKAIKFIWNFTFSDMAKPIGPTGRSRTTNVRLLSVGKKKCTKSLLSWSALRRARTLS